MKHECYVFLSDKMAEQITLTVGEAFDLAYKVSIVNIVFFFFLIGKEDSTQSRIFTFDFYLFSHFFWFDFRLKEVKESFFVSFNLFDLALCRVSRLRSTKFFGLI